MLLGVGGTFLFLQFLQRLLGKNVQFKYHLVSGAAQGGSSVTAVSAPPYTVNTPAATWQADYQADSSSAHSFNTFYQLPS